MLAAAAPVFNHITCADNENTFMRKFLSVMDKLQKIIAYTYWWSELEIDGEQCVEFLIGNYRGDYINELRLLSKDYIRSVNALCTESDLARNFMDKPVLHLLIEICEVSLPALSHCRKFMEIVFDAVHKPLKRCISKSNHKNCHILAVKHCIYNDWQCRVAALHDISLQNNPKKVMYQRCLRRIMLGERRRMYR